MVNLTTACSSTVEKLTSARFVPVAEANAVTGGIATERNDEAAKNDGCQYHNFGKRHPEFNVAKEFHAAKIGSDDTDDKDGNKDTPREIGTPKGNEEGRGIDLVGSNDEVFEEIVVAHGCSECLVTEASSMALEAILARHVRRHLSQGREDDPADGTHDGVADEQASRTSLGERRASADDEPLLSDFVMVS